MLPPVKLLAALHQAGRDLLDRDPTAYLDGSVSEKTHALRLAGHRFQVRYVRGA